MRADRQAVLAVLDRRLVFERRRGRLDENPDHGEDHFSLAGIADDVVPELIADKPKVRGSNPLGRVRNPRSPVAQDLLLRELHGRAALDGLVFKGGTALRKLYAGNQGRFSTDLD